MFGAAALFVKNALQALGYLKSNDVVDATAFRDHSTKGDARTIQPGRAYDFDGTNDDFRLGVVHDFADFTFCAWVKPDAFTSKAVVGQNLDDYIRFDSTTQLTFRTSATANAMTFPALTAGQWVHVCVSRSGSTVSLYINGVLRDTKTNSDTWSIRNFGMANGIWHFDGVMFDIRLYSDASTQDEIDYIYTNGDCGTDPTTSNLFGHWKCDDTHSTTAYDSSGNGRNGTKTNITAGTFHYTGSDVPFSWQNLVGYTDDPTNGLVPRNEANTTKDATGADLEYSGRVPRNGLLIDSMCATFDGVDDYIPLASLVTLSADFSIRWKASNTTGDPSWFGYTSTDGLRSQSSNDTFRIQYNNVNLQLGSTGASAGYDDGVVRDYELRRVGATVSLYIDNQLIGSTSPTLADFKIKDIGKTFWGLADGKMCDFIVEDEGVVVLHLPMAEGAGTKAYDISGNDNHGTCTNITDASFWGSTQDEFHYSATNGFNGCGIFTGSEYGSFDAADTFNQSNPWVVEAEIYSTDADTSPVVVSSSNGNYSPLSISNTLVFCKVNGTNASATLPKNQWVHVRTTYTGGTNGTIEIWVDGVLETSMVNDASLVSHTAFLRIGANNTGTQFFEGRLRNIRIENNGVTYFDGDLATGVENATGSAVLTNATGITFARVPGSTATVDAENQTMNRPAGGFNDPGSKLDFTGGEPGAPWVSKVFKGFCSFVTANNLAIDTGVANVNISKIAFSFRAGPGGSHIRPIGASSNTGFGVQLIDTAGDRSIRVVSNSVFSSTGATILNDNQWYDVEVEHDGATLVVKIDGVIEINEAFAQVFNDSNAVAIGAGQMSPTTQAFDGDIKNVKLWNDADVLIGDWPLRKHFLDCSGQGNHATPDTGLSLPKGTLEAAYSFGDGRTAPNYVTQEATKESKFYTEEV